MLDDAIAFIKFVLPDACNEVDENELCQLLKFECLKSQGKYPLAFLALSVVINILRSTAIAFTVKGKFTLDTLVVDNVAIAKELRQLADDYAEQLQQCKTSFYRPARLVNVVPYCIESVTTLYHACKCELPVAKTVIIINNCNFECCDDCPDE